MKKYAKMIDVDGELVTMRVTYTEDRYKNGRHIILYYGWKRDFEEKSYYIWEKETGAKIISKIGKIDQRTFYKFCLFIVYCTNIEERIEEFKRKYPKCGK